MEDNRYESNAIHVYLGLIQNVINRMAANSSSCKLWAVTLMSAIIIVSNEKIYAILPVIFLCIFDAYYLNFERLYRKLYNEFLEKIKNGDYLKEIFSMQTEKSSLKRIKGTFCALVSFSVLPFYLSMALFIWIIPISQKSGG
ncbi:hypothetical protein R83H12_02395 [Fibrobacteria bacterium R8-3-H12]